MDYKTIKETYQEVKELRSERSKTFLKPDGNFCLVASRTPYHYHDGNRFREIDCTVDVDKVERTVYKARLLKDKIGYSFIYREDESRIDVRLDKIGGVDVDYVDPIIEGNKAIWYDLSTDFDFTLITCSFWWIKDNKFFTKKYENHNYIIVIYYLFLNSYRFYPTINW